MGTSTKGNSGSVAVGSSVSSGGRGGSISISVGSGDSGTGGQISFSAGYSFATKTGGAITIVTGNALGFGSSDDMTITSASSPKTGSGVITLSTGTAVGNTVLYT